MIDRCQTPVAVQQPHAPLPPLPPPHRPNLSLSLFLSPSHCFMPLLPLLCRMEYVRLLEQALRALGYHGVARQLEAESGVTQQPAEVAVFRAAVLGGDYDAALQVGRCRGCGGFLPPWGWCHSSALRPPVVRAGSCTALLPGTPISLAAAASGGSRPQLSWQLPGAAAQGQVCGACAARAHGRGAAGEGAAGPGNLLVPAKLRCLPCWLGSARGRREWPAYATEPVPLDVW